MSVTFEQYGPNLLRHKIVDREYFFVIEEDALSIREVEKGQLLREEQVSDEDEGFIKLNTWMNEYAKIIDKKKRDKKKKILGFLFKKNF